MQPDPYFQPDNSFLQSEQEKARKKKEEDKKKAFKPRMIVHPYFQNVSVDDAIKVGSAFELDLELMGLNLCHMVLAIVIVSFLGFEIKFWPRQIYRCI